MGANAQIAATVSKAPVLFGFSFVALAVHLGVLLGVGRLLGFSRRDLLLASNANIGGENMLLYDPLQRIAHAHCALVSTTSDLVRGRDATFVYNCG